MCAENYDGLTALKLDVLSQFIKSYSALTRDGLNRPISLEDLLKDIAENSRTVLTSGEISRHHVNSDDLYRYRGFVYNPNSRFVRLPGGGDAKLSKQEAAIFEPLIVSPETVIPCNVFTRYWEELGSKDPNASYRVHLGRLRGKIQDRMVGRQWTYIQTVNKSGLELNIRRPYLIASGDTAGNRVEIAV